MYLIFSTRDGSSYSNIGCMNRLAQHDRYSTFWPVLVAVIFMWASVATWQVLPVRAHPKVLDVKEMQKLDSNDAFVSDVRPVNTHDQTLREKVEHTKSASKPVAESAVLDKTIQA